MNNLITSAENLTMSSLEIAELTGKRHDNVKRTIETMVKNGVIVLPQFEEVKQNQSTSPNNKTLVYLFSGDAGRLDSITVVAQLSPEFTKALVERWDELEKQKSQPALPSVKELALMVIQAEEEKERLALEVEEKAAKIEADAPKVAFVENYVESNKTYSLRQAAKMLHFPPMAFNECLIRDKYLYRSSDGLVPYEKPICRKVFYVTTGTAGNGHNYSQTKITAYGLSYFAEKYATELLEVA